MRMNSIRETLSDAYLKIFLPFFLLQIVGMVVGRYVTQKQKPITNAGETMKQILLSKRGSTTLLLLTAVIQRVVNGDEYTHRYKNGDRVDLWVNKVRFLKKKIIGYFFCWHGVL